MAFSMSGMSSGQGGGVRIEEAGESNPITSNQLGFKALNGDKKARIQHAAWPEDNLPQPTSSLLSVASANGLLAAAGPEYLLVGQTQKIRDLVYASKDGQGQDYKEDIRDYEPYLKIAHSRIAYLAFSSDETCLVVSEEGSGELVAYSTSDLQAGRTPVALRLSTGGPLRALVPNPASENAKYFAAVTSNGDLLLADFEQQQLTQGLNGPTLMKNVSCVAWSTKGKQMVAGLADGSLVQLKMDGSVQARIPKPPAAQDGCFVSGLAWLGDNVFFSVYSEQSTTVSEYYVIDRDVTDKSNPSYKFKKLPELTFPVNERTPPHQYFARLKNYHPEELKELLLVSSSTSSDVAMVAKSTVSIEPSDQQAPSVNEFVFAQPDDDTRNAQLPLGIAGDTMPIGIAIDLSEPDGIVNPLPSDIEAETGIDKSPIPLPLLTILNNEGVLSSWAVVYNRSIIQRIPFPGFSALPSAKGNTNDHQMDTSAKSATTAFPQSAASTSKPITAASPFTTTTNSSIGSFAPASTIGQSGFGTGGGFANSNPQIGGKSSWINTGFGTNNTSQTGTFAQPAFGSPAPLGGAPKPMFGQAGSMSTTTSASPGFGQTGFSQGGPAFGQPGLGVQQTKPGFGQSAFGGQKAAGGSPFATAAPTGSSGFGAFANKGGFANQQGGTVGQSPFTTKSGAGSTFGQHSNQGQSPFSAVSSGSTSNVFAQPGTSSPFAKSASPLFSGPKTDNNTNTLGTTSSFKLPSLFKGDGTAKDDLPKPSGDGGFGLGGLGSMLGDTNKGVSEPTSREEEMEDDVVDTAPKSAPPSQKQPPSETPPSTISQPKTTPVPPVSNLFGNSQISLTTPQPTQEAKSGWSFNGMPSTTPKDTPAASTTFFSTKPVSRSTAAAVEKSEPAKAFGTQQTSFPKESSPKIKSEDRGGDEGIDFSNIPEAPLPPDPTSKPDYQAGDTSVSSNNSNSRELAEPPLPPDFIPANKSAETSSLRPDTSDLPEDGSELSSEFEDSGEDVTQDISSSEEHAEVRSEDDDRTNNVRTSPESSFGRVTDESPVASLTGGSFTKVISDTKTRPNKLFGEVGMTGPSFPPPRPQESPRSPSPIRKPPPQNFFRSSPERSFSAPPRPRSIIQDKKADYQQSALAVNAAKSQQENVAREKARQLAEQQAKAEADERENQPLEDDEDLLLQQELANPPEPTQNLDPFMMIQPETIFESTDSVKIDIPSQIEKLYRDINSMVITLGINARSLSAFMLYHEGQNPNQHWPAVLDSETPLDALNEEWVLGDISRLHEGQALLSHLLNQLQIHDAPHKLEECHDLLLGDVADLRTKLIALRKSTTARTQPGTNIHAPLSPEQLSIQHDLRKTSASVQTRLVQVEEEAAILRAKLAESEPSEGTTKRSNFFGGHASQKKPTVEAVINTVSKMTSMAEKKSADIDVLEAQLKKLDATLGTSTNTGQPQTPNERRMLTSTTTPKSGKSSIYHTPDSRYARSTRSTPGRGQAIVISTEDREKWRAKRKKREDVAGALRVVLKERHGQRSGSVTSTSIA